jgi:hypothetical protein
MFLHIVITLTIILCLHYSQVNSLQAYAQFITIIMQIRTSHYTALSGLLQLYVCSFWGDIMPLIDMLVSAHYLNKHSAALLCTYMFYCGIGDCLQGSVPYYTTTIVVSYQYVWTSHQHLFPNGSLYITTAINYQHFVCRGWVKNIQNTTAHFICPILWSGWVRKPFPFQP